MIAPFYKFGMFGLETSLVVAFVTGIAFGFFLERAGFGNARKLAAQFYFKDLRVLKVMFTAIVTAMTGLYVLSRLGVVDLSMVYLVPTFLVPQVVGGLVLGMGFAIGGYCPGTSCVSASTGRIDGIVYVLGMFAGLLAFGEVYPHIQSFTTITPMGQITLAKFFGIPYGVLVLGVVVMALGAFMAAEWAERRFGDGSSAGSDGLLGATLKVTPVRGLALALLALGLFAAVAGNPYRGAKTTVDLRDLALESGRGLDRIQAGELADSIIKGNGDYKLVDLRSPADFAAYHIPTAVNVAMASLGPDFAGLNDRILLYSDSEMQAAQAWFMLHAAGFKAVYVLKGGLEAWKSEVLFPSKPANATAVQAADFEKRAQVSRYFGGAPRDGGAVAAPAEANLPKLVAPPAPAEQGGGPRHKVKKEGC